MRNAQFIGGLIVASGLLLAGGAEAGGDPAAGKAIFNKICHNCHSIDVGVNKAGPSLNGVVGRPAGTLKGYPYSEAMRTSGQTWTPEALDVYLSSPRGTVHGIKMFFAGLGSPKDRADVIAYLQAVQQ
jgi:cytochrome c